MGPKRKHRAWRSIALSLLIFYTAWLTLLFVLQRNILFPRGDLPCPEIPEQGIKGIERVWLKTEQGPVEAWFVRGMGVSAARPGPAVIFTHGNAELIDYWPVALGQYTQWGISILLPEYRGYGRSAGDPSQAAIVADLLKFYDGLAQRPEVDRSRIFFHGRSLGGGAACALAAQRKPKALILQSTFKSIKSMAWSLGVPPPLVRDPFDSLSTVAQLGVPTLILHGKNDELIPFSHARSLSRASEGARLIGLDCGHNDCPPNIQQYWLDLAQFLGEAGILPTVSQTDQKRTPPEKK